MDLKEKVKTLSRGQLRVDKSVLNKNVQDLFNIFPDFGNVLQASSAVVAGSFPLQMIMNVVWSDSDVDIWTSSRRGVKNLISYFLQLDYELPSQLGTESLSEDYLRFGSTVKNIHFLHHIQKAKFPRVQIIVLRTYEDQKDTIYPILSAVNNFDIDACKVIFDGQKFLTMFDLTYLPEKETSIGMQAIETQSPFEWLRTLKRIHKYQDRGFKFNWTTLIHLKNANYPLSFILNNNLPWPKGYEHKGGTPSYGPTLAVAFRNHWNFLARGEDETPQFFYDHKTGVTYLIADGKVYYTNAEGGRAPVNFLNQAEPLPEKCLQLTEMGPSEIEVDQHLKKNSNLIISFGNSVYCYSFEQMMGYLSEFGEMSYTKFLNQFPNGKDAIKMVEDLAGEVNKILRIQKSSEIPAELTGNLDEHARGLVAPYIEDADRGYRELRSRYEKIDPIKWTRYLTPSDAIRRYFYMIVRSCREILNEVQTGYLRRSTLSRLREFIFKLIENSSSGRKSTQTFTVHFPCRSSDDQDMDKNNPFILLHFDVDILVLYDDFVQSMLAFKYEQEKFRHFSITPAITEQGPVIIPAITNEAYTLKGKRHFPQEEYKGCQIQRNIPLHRMFINPLDLNSLGRGRKNQAVAPLDEVMEKFGSIQMYQPSEKIEDLTESLGRKRFQPSEEK